MNSVKKIEKLRSQTLLFSDSLKFCFKPSKCYDQVADRNASNTPMKAVAAKSVRVGTFTTLQRTTCRDALPALKHMLDSFGYDGFGRSAFEEDAARQALRRAELDRLSQFLTPNPRKWLIFKACDRANALRLSPQIDFNRGRFGVVVAQGETSRTMED